MRRGAFTLTEILMSVAIMAILAGVMSLSASSIGTHTAKREAERVFGFISSQFHKARVNRSGFQIRITDSKISAASNVLDASTGCSYKLYAKKQNSADYDDTKTGLYYLTKPSGYSSWYETSPEYLVKTSTTAEGLAYIQINGQDRKTCYVSIGAEQ